MFLLQDWMQSLAIVYEFGEIPKINREIMYYSRERARQIFATANLQNVTLNVAQFCSILLNFAQFCSIFLTCWG